MSELDEVNFPEDQPEAIPATEETVGPEIDNETSPLNPDISKDKADNTPCPSTIEPSKIDCRPLGMQDKPTKTRTPKPKAPKSDKTARNDIKDKPPLPPLLIKQREYITALLSPDS